MMRSRLLVAVTLLFFSLVPMARSQEPAADIYRFTEADIAFLRQFSLSALPALPPAPGNAYADNLRAATLGKKLFFDNRLSGNEQFSCASCHQPQKYFTDGLPLARALGTTRRGAPSLLGAAWSPWQFWDGRKDSLWAQALAPLEHPQEQGISRVAVALKIIRYHRAEYQAVFGQLPDERALAQFPLPASPLGEAQSRENWRALDRETRATVNRIFSNVGKAIMAYERRLQLPPARFDRFVDYLAEGREEHSRQVLDADEVRGLRLFMGKANCASCHNGPLFTNFEFHNIGAPEADESHVDMGRYEGVAALVVDDFTCLSEWSDAEPQQCEEIRFLKREGPELVGAFKTPTLRNIAATAPYMQAGQFATLEQVLAHYNLPQPPFYDRDQHPNRPHFDILPLQLTEAEIAQVIAFLSTLTSPFPETDPWWRTP